MDISSSLSGTKEFRIVKRGYDPDEVDAFLDQIALGVAELKRKTAEAADRAAAATTGAPTATPAPPSDEIQRALILAQRAADEEVRKATAEGEALVAEAQERVAELLRRADEDAAERREQGQVELRREIAALEARRDALAADVAVLDRHVDEQREVVQAAVGELQSLLDHPEAFRVVPTSQVSGLSPAGVAAPAVPPRAGSHAAAEGDGDDDEEGDSPAEPDIDLDAPLPGRDDLSRALRADDEDDEIVVVDGPVIAAPPVSDAGPPTQALDPVDSPGEDEDVFLAELRKAMLDEEPLGPRDETFAPSDDGVARVPRSRFGRRR